jgi:hypothetical protein
MDDCACYDLSYSDLDQAREIFEALEPADALAREASA